MARRTIIAGNWKMYTTIAEARDLIKGLAAGMARKGDREVAVFPPAVNVREVVSLCSFAGIDVGVQNIYFEDNGAFTGETSPVMAKDCGCRYVLIGHSERRHVFGETDDDVNKKVHATLKHGLDPMICVGELLDEREKGATIAVLERQLTGAFKGIRAEQVSTIVIAYEPVWAIGTGKVATPEIAQETHKAVRAIIEKLYSSAVAAALPILYGGSVKPDNIAGLIVQEDIDGVLVGGASLKAESFVPIITA